MNNKRTFAIIVFALVCVGTTYAQSEAITVSEPPSQEKQNIVFTGGAILEGNLSGFFHSGIKDGNNVMKAGFSLGGFLNLGVIRSFSVQGEMLFHYKNSEFEQGSQRGDLVYWGVEIPVYAMYHYTFSRGGCLQVGIGPYTEFGFDAKFKHGGKEADLYEKDGSTGLAAFQESNSGFGAKVGYEFVSGFQINASYKASISNLLDANSSQVKIHPHAISIGVAYRFGK